MIRLPWRRAALPQKPDGPAPASRADSPDSVSGERGASLGGGARSLQARMSSVLAAGLMISVGAGMLAWYYAEALSHPAAAHRRTQAPAPEAPGEGVMLPAFGSVAPSPSATQPAPAPSRSLVAPSIPVSQPAAAAQSTAALAASSLLEPPLTRAPSELPQGYGAPAQLSPRQQALARRLSGQVFAQAPRGLTTDLAAGTAETAAAAALPEGGADGQTGSGASNGDGLQRLLHPSVLAATRAQMLPGQRLLLPQGTFIDCTLETAIDSTLPGMTTCVTATDTFSADGTVVLLERGTKLIGETRGEVSQGQARVFVVWTEARTPAGVVVRLDSPGTDALGRSGLEGKVNSHFWQRFGAALLVSTIDGAVQSEVESSSRGGAVVIDPTASEDVLTGILRSTVSIPPTIRVRNGARIQVLVARDVDFRAVYELAPR